MNEKTTAIVITAAATVLCGCPGLFSLFMGGMFALISFVPGADIDVFGSSDPQTALAFGVSTLCAGLIMVLIAAAAIFFAWRRNAGAAPETEG